MSIIYTCRYVNYSRVWWNEIEWVVVVL